MTYNIKRVNFTFNLFSKLKALMSHFLNKKKLSSQIAALSQLPSTQIICTVIYLFNALFYLYLIKVYNNYEWDWCSGEATNRELKHARF